MMYVKIDKATGAKIAGPMAYDGQPANPDHKPHAWVPLVKVANPDFDPATQKLVAYQRHEAGEWRVGHDVEALTAQESTDRNRDMLNFTDRDMARIAEDLIDVLVAKGVFALSDFAKPVRDKLALRKSLR